MAFHWLRRSVLLFSLILVACNLGDNGASPVATSTSGLPLGSGPIPQDGTQPVSPHPGSFTPSPAFPSTAGTPRVVMVAPEGTGSPQVAELEALLSDLAGKDGLELEVRTSMHPDALHPGIRLLVALPPDPGLASLAAAAPETQFLAVGIPGLAPAANLSAITFQDSGHDHLGFLAGYTAAVVTPEWRVAVIAVSDTPAGVSARQGFLNGVVFFCGLCRQTYPPFHTYPLSVALPASSGPAEWQASAQALLDQSVRTVYLTPGAGDEALLSFLAEAGVNLIGAGPPPASIRSHWIASVRYDLAASLRPAWPALIAGDGGLSLPASIRIADVNPELFSPGRQALVDEFLQDLLAGFIATGVEPAAGAAP